MSVKWVAAGSYLTTDTTTGRVVIDTANLGNSLALHIIGGEGNLTLSLQDAEQLAGELVEAVQVARAHQAPALPGQDPLIPEGGSAA